MISADVIEANTSTVPTERSMPADDDYECLADREDQQDRAR